MAITILDQQHGAPPTKCGQRERTARDDGHLSVCASRAYVPRHDLLAGDAAARHARNWSRAGSSKARRRERQHHLLPSIPATPNKAVAFPLAQPPADR